ncbi:MAG: spore cortex biosynthesis protein YabQ, partial [Clostridia bacterium]
IGCVFDIVFCCAVFLIVYSSILTLCYGECRPYIFFAICLGLLIYIKIVRLPLDKVKLKLYNLIYKGRKNNESNLRK